jgi:hypothetical protein
MKTGVRNNQEGPTVKMSEMFFYLEPIKRRIRAAFPNSEISVVGNARDIGGGVLYVRNAPREAIGRIGVTMDYIVVPLDDRPATDILVVPIPFNEEKPDPKTEASARE